MWDGVKSPGSKKRKNSFIKRHAMKGEWSQGQDISKKEKTKQFQGPILNPKVILLRRGLPKGDVNGKFKGMCFDCNEVGHYSKDCLNPNWAMGVLR